MTEMDALKRALQSRLDAAADGDCWPLLAEAGVLGLPFREEHGGLGLDVRDGFAVLEVLGASARPGAYLETVLLAGRLLDLAGDEAAARLLPEVAAGKRKIALADVDDPRLPLRAQADADGWVLDGRKIIVIAGAEAGHVLALADAAGESAAFLLSRDMLECKSLTTIDGRPAADLRFMQLRLPRAARLAVTADEIERTQDVGAAAVAAEAAAIMLRLVRDTRDYLAQRQQFDQPIASFQAVQHRLVDMHIESRRAVAAAALARNALDLDARARAAAVSAAKVTIVDTARFVGRNAVQLHGGMGMTEELPVSALFRRLTVIESEFGSRDAHLLRYMAMA